MRRVLPLLLLASACSKTSLFVPHATEERVIDNRISIRGGFCAEGAQDLRSYFKVLFIIDRSNSMLRSDPNNRRVTAAQEAVMQFIDDTATLRLREGVEFAIMSFFGDTIVHTRDERGLPGFTSDGTQVLSSLAQVAFTSANTGYDKALAQAFTLLDRDMAQLEVDARERSRYEVIFISDGFPFPDNCLGEPNSGSAAVRAVQRVVSLSSLYKVPVRFSTGFASTPEMFLPGNDTDDGCTVSDVYEAYPTTGEETRQLLQDMADKGGGTFRQFLNGDSISFVDFGFSDARRIYAMSSFVASNQNAHASGRFMEADTDRDGLIDSDEFYIGTSLVLADSDYDGFSDLVEWRFRLNGLDPLDPTDAKCDETSAIDTDGDGLRDCEEVFVGTLRRKVDTDADGLPDNIEVLFGTDANSANPMQDRQGDSDADGGSNFDEVRWHTDPSLDDVSDRPTIAYDYRLRELPLTTGQACYDFDVRNLRLASTRAVPQAVAEDGIGSREGTNRVMLYFAQTPYDDPLDEPIYRIACVEARFVADRDLKVPASGHIEVPVRRPSDTYRASDVLRPNDDVCNVSVNQDCGLDALWCHYDVAGTCSCFRPPATPAEAAASPNGIPVGGCPSCADGQDNDGDGRTDFPFDPDCFDSMDSDEAPNVACTDGVDNDGDGNRDWPDDAGCDSGYDNDETDPATPPECSDGIDNDNDGVMDFPQDPSCDFAADPQEGLLGSNPPPACDDGYDNDGDGRIDFDGGPMGGPADPGCFNAADIDETGPSICFYCERITDALPGQCDIGAGFCRARAGDVVDNGTTSACTSRADCRGAPCISGVCVPCIEDADCDTAIGAGDGLCDSDHGWCLTAAYTPTPCTTDGECPASGCDTAIGYCRVDPYYACRNQDDCRVGDLCSNERGFCLTKVFETRQCNDATPCATGACDEGLGWCLPAQATQQCRDDDECPYGNCLSGHCDQQSFVFPSQFRPEVDCLRAQ